MVGVGLYIFEPYFVPNGTKISYTDKNLSAPIRKPILILKKTKKYFQLTGELFSKYFFHLQLHVGGFFGGFNGKVGAGGGVEDVAGGVHQ